VAARANPIVSFVVPVRNDAARLDRCLRSIRAGTYPPELVEIVVADNGSTDNSAAVARSHGAVVLDLPGLRLGALRNRAAAAAGGAVLAFVDADHEIVPGWIPAAVSTLDGPGVAAAGAACFPPDPGTWVQRLYDRLRPHPSRAERVDWLGSGNMAVKRTAFEAAGGFDVSLETCEDVDLCRKIRAGGHEIVADPRLRNIHYGDPGTLGRVFFGELWRGRDNVRVSLRAPRTWRTLVSAAMPVAHLLLLVIAIGAIAAGLTFSRTWLLIAAAALLLVCGSIAARAGRMAARPADWPAALSVAAAYEMGRALALTGWSPYRLRRKEASADA
jgi:hypothetical protein